MASTTGLGDTQPLDRLMPAEVDYLYTKGSLGAKLRNSEAPMSRTNRGPALRDRKNRPLFLHNHIEQN